ncbi:MAG: metallophosphoesterase [Angelakisella sp.]|jgi:Icc-related predicted phosphoesterase|nr:metallophosphoesterase [Angelakisella sp.]
MRILVISDEESPALWDYFDRRRLEGVDLILSAGDLNPEYLSFLVTFCHAPLLYVHGNHDDRYRKNPPGGCICVENRIHVCKGLRILGLGGSMRYKQKGEHQYTQGQMNRRVLRMTLPLLKHKGFDILLTHAPAYNLNDGDDLAHTGFEAFRSLMDRYRPKYFIHGHVHLSYNPALPRLDTYGETQVINGFGTYYFDY